MVLNKNYVILVNVSMLLFIFFVSGCAKPQSIKSVYEQGYRLGVIEQMETIAAKFQGGKFPYYQWTQPIVQDVKVPAHIANGVFIPEHNELVLIKPGEWQQSPAYPISGINVSSNQEKKDHEQTTITDNNNSTDLTVLP